MRAHGLVLAMLFLGCDSKTGSGSAAQGRPARRAPRHVSGAEARALVGQGALLLDVRSPQEFAEVHLPGALNVPIEVLDGAMDRLPRDRPIVVHCAVGSRSVLAAQMLAANGFDARDMGGIDAWAR